MGTYNESWTHTMSHGWVMPFMYDESYNQSCLVLQWVMGTYNESWTHTRSHECVLSSIYSESYYQSYLILQWVMETHKESRMSGVIHLEWVILSVIYHFTMSGWCRRVFNTSMSYVTHCRMSDIISHISCYNEWMMSKSLQHFDVIRDSL